MDSPYSDYHYIPLHDTTDESNNNRSWWLCRARNPTTRWLRVISILLSAGLMFFILRSSDSLSFNSIKMKATSPSISSSPSQLTKSTSLVASSYASSTTSSHANSMATKISSEKVSTAAASGTTTTYMSTTMTTTLSEPSKTTLDTVHTLASSASPPARDLQEPAGTEENDLWKQFSYVQYVTNEDYLCNSLMIFESLHRLGCRAQRLMMYPDTFSPEDMTEAGQMLAKARDEYNVVLQPIEVQYRRTAEPTWSESYTKLLAMNMTQHAKRVLSLDSDATVLQCMDELFLLPSAPIAMPRAYWELPNKKELTSSLLLMETNSEEFQRIMDEVKGAGSHDFDMDILNNLYGDSAMVLPHRRYELLSGEFKRKPQDHANYLGSADIPWDADAALREAKYVHFSDFPLPKPWRPMGEIQFRQHGPKCHEGSCKDKRTWKNLYGDFRKRRYDVCGIDVNGYIRKQSLRL